MRTELGMYIMVEGRKDSLDKNKLKKSLFESKVPLATINKAFKIATKIGKPYTSYTFKKPKKYVML